MPNGLIQDDSLRTHPEGLALSLTLPWYRSLWLSSVSTLRLTVDGEEVPAGDLAFELDGARYALDELPQQSDVLWYLQAHPLLIAKRAQPVALGETHDVELFVCGLSHIEEQPLAAAHEAVAAAIAPEPILPHFVSQATGSIQRFVQHGDCLHVTPRSKAGAVRHRLTQRPICSAIIYFD